MFCLTVVSARVYAEGDFVCEIKFSASLESDGLLNENTEKSKYNIDKEFKVIRTTGRITSDSKRLDNLWKDVKPTIYDYLPGENSYKVMTVTKPNNVIIYLEIKEYVKDKHKPFIYKQGSSISTGLCTYL